MQSSESSPEALAKIQKTISGIAQWMADCHPGSNVLSNLHYCCALRGVDAVHYTHRITSSIAHECMRRLMADETVVTFNLPGALAVFEVDGTFMGFVSIVPHINRNEYDIVLLIRNYDDFADRVLGRSLPAEK